jgi:hypothetical protein
MGICLSYVYEEVEDGEKDIVENDFNINLLKNKPLPPGELGLLWQATHTTRMQMLQKEGISTA